MNFKREEVKIALDVLNAVLDRIGDQSEVEIDLETIDQDRAKIAAAVALDLIIPRKGMGTRLFDAHARHGINIAFEAAAIRDRNGTAQVYLTQRSLNDTAYPGQWHIPGSFVRSGESWDDVVNRLSNVEFKTEVLDYTLVERVSWLHEARGHIYSDVYLVRLKDEDTNQGKWFDVEDLPQPMVDAHRDVLIPMAVLAFKKKEDKE